jgi:hypothetical protein
MGRVSSARGNSGPSRSAGHTPVALGSGTTGGSVRSSSLAAASTDRRSRVVCGLPVGGRPIAQGWRAADRSTLCRTCLRRRSWLGCRSTRRTCPHCARGRGVDSVRIYHCVNWLAHGRVRRSSRTRIAAGTALLADSQHPTARAQAGPLSVAARAAGSLKSGIAAVPAAACSHPGFPQVPACQAHQLP